MTDRSVGVLHDEVAAAVERGEVGTAAELQRELDAASPAVDELLAEYREAAEAGEYEKAKTILGKVGDRIREKRTDEIRSLERSLLARDSPGTPRSKLGSIDAYVETLSRTNLVRAGFLTEAIGALDREDATAVADSESTASSLESAEGSVEDAKGSVEAETSDETLPPSVAVLDASVPDETLSTGVSATVTATVGNVGDETARDVVVAVETREGLQVNGSSRSVGTVSGNGEASVSFEVTASDPGQYAVAVDVESANAGEATGEVTVEVVGANPEGVLEHIAGENRTVEFQEVVEAISLYNQEQTVPGTDRELEFQDVLRVIAAFNEEEPV